TSAKPAISVPETPLPAVPAVTSAPPVVVVTPVPLPPVKSVTISTSAPPILSDTKPTTPQVLPSGLVVTAPTQAPGVTSAKPGISAPEKPLTSVMTNNVTVTSPTLPATTNITAKPVADTASLLQSYPPGIEKRLLIVDTNGIGRVLPETGGMAWLAVGRTVTLVAEPGIGHRFTGWSGSIVASTPTVTFTMRSNVVLMANFVPFDSISVPAPVPTPAPTVALQPAPIPIPAPATVVTSPPPSVPVFTPREMVPEPTVTTRTTTPGKGPQELRMVLLTLETTGAGTISPKWNGRLLEVGKTYALVAEPGRGQVFAGWSGDMESASQRITFTPRANTRLVANFVPVTAARPTQTPKVATQTAPAPTVTPPQPTPTPVAPAPATVPPRMVAQPTASATTVPPVPAFTSTATLQPSPIPPIEVPARPVVTPPPVETVPSPVPTAPIPAAIAQAVPPPGPMPIAPAPVVPAETLTTTAKAAEAAPVKTSKMPHWIQRLIYLNPPYKQEESQRVAKMTGVTPAEAVESAPKPRGKSLPNAPMGLLALDTTGAGRIVPIAASQFLEVGKTYTLTAVPDLGSEFTGWSGDIETNKATITFMMRSTIALQANFRPGAGPLAVAPTPTPGPPQVLTPPAVTAPAPPLTSTQGMRLPSGLLLPPQQLPVLSRFTLETNGQGRVTPDYGGKYLDLGRAYTLTAEPSPGWEFLGWTGGANSSSARIQFIMESNMVLRANFARVTMEDRVRPAVAIFSPTEGERVRDSVVTVRGVASDNVAVARVEYQAGSADFRVADGTTNWIARVPAAPGTNTIVVRAVDTAGNESVLVSRSFIYVQYSLFTLRARGQGRVVPDLNGKLLEVGHTYMLTAEPSPGWQFAGWVDGINPEKQTLNFVMQPDLVMEARFEPKAAPLAVMTNAPPVEPFVYHPPGDTFAGRYNGLFYNTNALAPTSAGYFIVTVTESGTFYGRLDLGEQSFPLSGRLDAQGRAQQTIQAQGRTAMLLSFQTDARGDQLTGQLKDDTFTAQLFGDRQAFDGKALASVAAGSYTLVIPGHTNVAAPVGDGFGTVTVDATGRLSFRGELADGTPVSQEAILSKAGVWPLHVPLYQGRGALMGWVTITNGAPVDLYGQVHWFKPPAKDDRYYPAGFSTRVYMFGSSYMVPAGQRDVTARLTGLMRGGNLDEQVMENISIGVDNRPAPVKGNSAFVLTLASNNGTLSGNFLHPVTRRATPFKGVLLQKQNWASGYFLGTNQSGMVFLRAQPEQ
ncbi:MAG: Ig-like domain-containing protein, partial [Verrucomicrobia bacterium]|nr:Ig-like domain-containing protein [Verrucomicrobiota bacterium]